MGTKHRGYVDVWRMRKPTQILLNDAIDVLNEFREMWPVTLRQLYYQLVVRKKIEKSEEAYDSLGYVLKMARRNRRIPFHIFRDDRQPIDMGGGAQDASEFWEDVRWSAGNFLIDLQLGQPRRTLLWCETAGMRPMLAKIGKPFGVSANCSGGFDSVTKKWQLSQQIASAERVTILYIGDYDASGVTISNVLDEDVLAFVEADGGDILFERIAIEPEQIERFDLPTAPPNPNDVRGDFNAKITVQAEALSPTQLQQVVEEAIVRHMDMDLLKARRDEQTKIQEQLVDIVDSHLGDLLSDDDGSGGVNW